jgi:hypothetical protein
VRGDSDHIIILQKEVATENHGDVHTSHPMKVLYITPVVHCQDASRSEVTERLTHTPRNVSRARAACAKPEAGLGRDVCCLYDYCLEGSKRYKSNRQRVVNASASSATFVPVFAPLVAVLVRGRPPAVQMLWLSYVHRKHAIKKV